MKVPRPLAELALKLGGWTPIGTPPPIGKYVLISQHTSNWDFVWMLAFASHFGLDLHWIGKEALFRWPFRRLMRALGGIPVDRNSSHDLVAQMAAEFSNRDTLLLAIAPEGTRKFVDHWKSGFYRIAQEAGVPIVPVRLDYARRVGGFDTILEPTGNLRADMDLLRAFYALQSNKVPALTGTVRLKSED